MGDLQDRRPRPALKKHYESEPGKTLGSLIGDIAFWLILLVGIMLALQPLGLSQVLEPYGSLPTTPSPSSPISLPPG
jgi:hypothetical protein